LFVGIPAAVIVGLGALFSAFRDPILGSARNLGEVFQGIFTQPVVGFIGGISEAFGNLPNINVRIPSLNISGGGINIPENFFNILPNIGQPGGQPDIDDVPLAPDETLLCRLFGIGCPGGEQPQPPIPEPEPEPPMMDPQTGELFGGRFAESFNVQTSQGVQNLSFEEVQGLQPGAVLGLFDVLGTQETEFLPFNLAGVQGSLEAGQRLRLSGQVFQDIRGIGDVEALF